MGWTLLYIAFGAVAVWLLAEVLLQYKARLRWRLLAFGGFAMVVVGVVLLSSVVVIALGAAAFAVGQTFVTLSYRRGFTAGWALGGMPGTSRRRREVRPLPPEDAEPRLEVSDLRPEPPAEAPAYRPEPLPDDTGQYGVYERDSRSGEPQDPGSRYTDHPGHGPEGGQDPYADANGHYGYGYGGGDQYAPYPGGYPGEQPAGYPNPYPDPYGGAPAQPPYDGQYTAAPDGARGFQGETGPAYPGEYGPGHAADPYAGQAPSAGGWVPQQRGDEPQTGQYGYGYPQDDGYGASSGAGYYYGEQQPRP
ncbi:hypothetical protein GCM10010420_47220 [Streptomyces glaucosporus]|uniref:Integral membrane protein n=1 Tax=Streptomyces glaucosporus TaxID=284044 RepID=A0ABN3IU44_9ACTN